MKKVTIYKTPNCKYCEAEAKWLSDRNILFTTIDVSKDLEARKHIVALTHQMGVPVTTIDDGFVVGFTEEKFSKLFEKEINVE